MTKSTANPSPASNLDIASLARQDSAIARKSVMSTFQRVATALVVLGLASGCDTESPEALDLFGSEHESEAPLADAGLQEREDAELVAELTIDDSTLRFLNETPSGEVPSISVVVVEQDRASSLLDPVLYQSASPLELFLALAPEKTVPLALELDHIINYEERGLLPEPRTLDPEVSPRANPTVEDDTWGDGCTRFDDWQTGFNSWSANAASWAHLSFDNPADDVYGYFGTNDYIWAGVCRYQYGPSSDMVSMQYQWNGMWYTVSGAALYVWVEQRYLYHSFSPNAPSRRIKVHHANGNDFYLSGAWKDFGGYL